MYTFLESAIVDALSAEVDLVTLVGTQIFVAQAPLDIVAPYVVFTQLKGGFVVDSPRLALDVVYRVECVGLTQAQSRAGANLIHDALHAQPLSITGWSHYATTAENWFDAIANREGSQWYRCGAEYRIRADQD